MKEIFLNRDCLTDFNSIGILLLRLIAGICLLMHGLPKASAPMNWMGDKFPGILQLLAVFFEVNYLDAADQPKIHGYTIKHYPACRRRIRGI